jgi:hypothetical protein
MFLFSQAVNGTETQEIFTRVNTEFKTSRWIDRKSRETLSRKAEFDHAGHPMREYKVEQSVKETMLSS